MKTKVEDFAQISIRKYEMLQKIKRELHDSVCFSMDNGRFRYDKYQFYNETEAIKIIKEERDSFEKHYNEYKKKTFMLKNTVKELEQQLKVEQNKNSFWSFLN